jgi:hypothetical protein
MPKLTWKDIRPCPNCHHQIRPGEEYPAHEDQPEPEWNLCPECGTELSWNRRQHTYDAIMKHDVPWKQVENSGGPSGYTTAFTHPDPMEPNDRVRQKTQSRAPQFPYDRPVTYGKSSHASFDGDERQDGADDGPPLARQYRPGRPLSVWDRLSDSVVRTASMGPIGSGYESEVQLGTGNHGRMGEEDEGMDAVDLEIDALQRDFRSSYEEALETTDGMDSPSLFTLLTRLDPEFSAETFAPEDEDEMRDIYTLWASRMAGE